MPKKSSSPVDAHLAQIPAARRKELERVRAVIRDHLPRGYEEAMAGKIIVYEVPLARYADTYNGHALWYVALAAQKNYLSLYLMNCYGSASLMKEAARRLRGGGQEARHGQVVRALPGRRRPRARHHRGDRREHPARQVRGDREGGAPAMNPRPVATRGLTDVALAVRDPAASAALTPASSAAAS